MRRVKHFVLLKVCREIKYVINDLKINNVAYIQYYWIIFGSNASIRITFFKWVSKQMTVSKEGGSMWAVR